MTDDAITIAMGLLFVYLAARPLPAWGVDARGGLFVVMAREYLVQSRYVMGASIWCNRDMYVVPNRPYVGVLLCKPEGRRATLSELSRATCVVVVFIVNESIFGISHSDVLEQPPLGGVRSEPINSHM